LWRFFALASSDYMATAGTLKLAGSEISQSFSVPMLDNAMFEGAE
jgi:hypothetical protein